jgi:glycosyltransferase involved in cell wall biosynthesis
MPAYNCENYIFLAIESILNQTYTNWELLIVNDSSTDGTQKIIDSFKDTRIKKFKNSTNKGCGFTNRIAFLNAKGDYFCRLDSDDIATQNRLEILVDFMENNKQYVMIGSGCFLIDDFGELIGNYKKATDSLEILWKSNFKNPFIAPTVMYKKEIRDTYKIEPKDFNGSDDYAMWCEILKIGKTCIIDEQLIYYRKNSFGLTSKNQTEMANDFVAIAFENFNQNYNNLKVSKTDFTKLLEWYKSDVKQNNRYAKIYKLMLLQFVAKYRTEFGIKELFYKYNFNPTFFEKLKKKFHK